jgi:Response regulator containing CheY-like receiver and SARP domains
VRILSERDDKIIIIVNIGCKYFCSGGDLLVRVVIVEDDVLAKDQCIDYFKISGIQVNECIDRTTEIVEKILEFMPDVVFIDVIISGIDGLSVGKKLMENNDSIKLIFIANDGKYASDAFSIGAVDFLIKPLKTERLAMTLRRVVNE